MTLIGEFRRASNALKNKNNIPKKYYNAIWKEANINGFTVAGAMQEDLLKDIKTALLKARKENIPLAEFQKTFDILVAKRGWTDFYVKKFNDANTGRIYKRWRAKVIYETNLRQSYSAGREQQARDLGRQYKVYKSILDDRARPRHKGWHNTVLPIDDKWWDTHTPMNGWGCRCYVNYVNKNQAERIAGKPLDELKAPRSYKVPKIVRKNGRRTLVRVPAGIDPGFDYNPGTKTYNAASGKTKTNQLANAVQETKALTAVTTRKNPTRSIKNINQAKAIWRSVFFRAKRTYKDPHGQSITLNRDRLFGKLKKTKGGFKRLQYLPYLKDTLTKPQEIGREYSRTDKAYRYYYFKKYKIAGEEKNIMLISGIHKDNNSKQGIFNMLDTDDDAYITNKRKNLDIIYRDK